MLNRREFFEYLRGVAGLAVVSGAASSRAGARSNRSGFWAPDEAEPHLRTYMQWPASSEVHPEPAFLAALQQSVADIANTIAQFEPVVMLMAAEHRNSARKRLSSSVEMWDIPTDDLWCRDSGPVFVRDEKGVLAISHLNFNGWGNRQTHANDGKIAKRVAERLGLPVFDNGLVGEAGGVESDGQGTLIAHESSWVVGTRNEGSKAEIERLLLQALGGEKLIWAPGIKGADITDYHIDSLARFTRPGQVLIQLPERVDERDPWSAAAFETYEILKRSTDAGGKPLALIVVPEPYDTRIASPDFVASYVNYYVCNGAVVAARFGDDDTDAEARDLLATAFPGREIVTVDVDPIGQTGGGIHCATQQQPAI